MTEISDETLMAYADGLLDAAERQRISVRVAASPRIAQRLAHFERTTCAVLSAAFEPIRSAPVPQRLLDVLSEPATSALSTQPAAAGWRSYALSLRRWLDSAGSPASHSGFGLAVPAVLAVALLVAMLARQVPEPDAFRIALETARSGETIRMSGSGNAGERRLTPVLSFVSRDGRPCRRYRLERPDAGLTEGVACRNAAGRWMIDIEADTGRHSSPGAYVTAGGADGDAIDDRIGALIQGSALGRAEEDTMLRKGWR
ncbi:MAG: hypothetical protein ACT4N2_09320 [Hyphomicrobium sp.]